MNEWTATGTGRLVADPEIGWGASGTSYCRFTLATNPRTKVEGEWKDGPTEFYDCVAFGTLGEHVVQSLKKGDSVVVSGQLSIERYDRKDGGKGTSVKLKVSEMGVNLRFNDVKVARLDRGSAGNGVVPAKEDDPWASEPAF